MALNPLSLLRIAVVVIAAGLALPAPEAGAQDTERRMSGLALSNDEPIQIESDLLKIDEETSKATFTGNVTVVQGDTMLQAGRMIVNYDKDGGSVSSGAAEIREIDRALAELGGDDRTRARELDLLRYQLDELDAAGLEDPDEDDRLDEEEDLLADAVRHREVAEQTSDALVGDDGIHDRLQTVVGSVAGRAPFVELESRLRSAAAELSEAAHDLRDLVDAITDDPERLDSIRRRRHQLSELRRKYGETLADVIAERERVRERLDELSSHDQRAEELDRRRLAAMKAERAAAAVVAKARRAAAPALGGGVQERLRELAMPHAEVVVDVSGDDPADDVSFLLAANPGSPPQPMAKVASGGELSRSTLALRLELTVGPPSLVFDEVDTGIGGEAAWAVARSLQSLADRHQILVVTHLPQVAAFAGSQLSVTKRAAGGSTEATVVPLDDDARVEEIARMLSGQPDSDVGRDHAIALLAEASGTTP